jgi:hypothetical protein
MSLSVNVYAVDLIQIKKIEATVSCCCLYGSWLVNSKLRAQICSFLLAGVVSAGGNAHGGMDVKMFHCLVFNGRL